MKTYVDVFKHWLQYTNVGPIIIMPMIISNYMRMFFKVISKMFQIIFFEDVYKFELTEMEKFLDVF